MKDILHMFPNGSPFVMVTLFVGLSMTAAFFLQDSFWFIEAVAYLLYLPYVMANLIPKGERRSASAESAQRVLLSFMISISISYLTSKLTIQMMTPSFIAAYALARLHKLTSSWIHRST